MTTRVSAVAFLAALLITMFSAAAPASAGDGGDITGSNRHSGGIVIGGTTSSPGRGAGPAGTAEQRTTRTISCDLTGAISAACQGAANTCIRPPLAPPDNAIVVQQQQPNGTWRQISADCDGNGAPDALAVVTAEMVRQQVVRLLPPVAVGVAPADGPTLVNLETIFWSPTAATRQLGPVTILGQSVAITIRFDHATYDYGDGTTATTTSPGTPWTEGACDTAQCPSLDGHTYTTPADTVTARSTITWTATFTVGDGAAQPIPGTIDGPTSAHDLQVLEGRSVIVR
jgi:hypothetical protein